MSEQAPVAIGNRTFTSKARFVGGLDRQTVFHSEYIGDITGSTSPFLVTRKLMVNPGLDSSFPWLAQIASRYESYRFKKLHYRFNTERPTTEPGYIAIVPDYDVSDPPPPDKISAFQYQSSAKSSPWQNLLQVNLGSDMNKRKTYYTRRGPLASGLDNNLYDCANVHICVGGNSGEVILGQLWCDYEVELMTPQVDLGLGVIESSKILSGGTLAPANPLGTAPTVSFSGPTFYTYDISTSTLTFNRPFDGLIVWSVDGTGLVGSGSSISGTSAGVTLSFVTSSGSTSFLIVERISATAGKTIVLSISGTTVTNASCYIAPYAYAL